MMIITDTASDLFENEAAQMNVHVLPLDIRFGGENFNRNIQETFNRFYQMLDERDDFPATSQPAPERYCELYRQAKEAGEEVLVITLSGALSGTVESARMAAKIAEYEDHITIMDSRHAISSLRMIVERAVQLRDEGKTIPEILPELEYLRDHIRICGVLGKMEYLKRGGRIPATLATVGDLLNIKPVVAVADGAVESIGKVHGIKAGEKFLRKEFAKHPYNPEFPISFLYSGQIELAEEFADTMEKDFGIDKSNARWLQIGPTIGAHLGPGCVGLMFVSKEPIEVH